MSRYLISVVLGGFITLALAYLMQFLIFSETIPEAEASQVTPVQFLRIDRPEDLSTRAIRNFRRHLFSLPICRPRARRPFPSVLRRRIPLGL